MKKRILPLLLALLMVFEMLPVSSFADDFVPVPPECDKGCNTDSVSAHQDQCAVKEYYSEIYRTYSAKELYAMKDVLGEDAWTFIVDQSWNMDNAKAMELKNLIDNGESTDPSDPDDSCTCCENCTGAEDCQCQCGACDFCQPEEPELPTLTHPTGVEVTAESFPEGVTLSVKDADVSAQLGEFKIPESKKVFGLDISLVNADSSQYQPDGALVKVPVEAAPGTKIGIIHDHNGVITFMGVTEVQTDGTVEFYTDSFSEFAGFTVDFHYNGVDFSIEGMSSILLSDLFTAMGIEEDAYTAQSVVFSDNTLVGVTQQDDGNWLLTSLEAFSTNETLIITFIDGHTIVIDVTDANPATQNTNDQVLLNQVGTDKSYQIFGKLYPDVYGNYNSFATTLFGVEVDFVLYEGNAYPGSGNGSKVATAWIDQAFAGVQFNLSGNYWYEVYDTYRCQVSEKGTNNFVFDSTNVLTGREVYIRRYSRATYSNSSYCTVIQASAMSDSKTTRTVYVYANGTQVGSWTGYFPDRNSASANDLSVTPHGNWKRRGDVTDSSTVVVSGGNYYVYLVSQHTISYDTNGGSGTFANQTKTYGVQLNLHSDEPTKTGYKFNHWVSQYDGSTWAKGANFTPDRTDTLKADYSPVSYTATFIANGGSVSPTSKSFNIEGSLSLPTPTAPEGYTFDGWKITSATGNWTNGKTYSVSTSSIPIGMYGDVTFTAQWSAISYTVTYDLNGATSGAIADQTHKFDEEFTLPTPEKEYTVSFDNDGNGTVDSTTTVAYTFNGWEDRGTIVYNGVSYDAAAFDGPYYANTYSDLYNAFQYNKYALIGHYVNNGKREGRSCIDPKIVDGENVRSYYQASRLTVKNLASTAVSVPLKANWSSNSITLPTLSETGKRFLGWSDGTKTYAAGDSFTPTKNVTLTALWEDDTYTVTWKNWNGDVLETDTVAYNGSATFDKSRPTRPDANGYSYSFTGWDQGTNDTVSNVTANITVTAQYSQTPISYTATFDYNGGDAGVSSNTFNVTTALSLPTLTRTGYTGIWKVTTAAGNWENDKEYPSAGSIAVGQHGNVTFTAQWTPITYTIRFVGGEGATGSVAEITATYDKDVTLPENGFQRIVTVTYNANGGKNLTPSDTVVTLEATLQGWRLDSDTLYAQNETVKNLASAQDSVVTLYAEWGLKSTVTPTVERDGYTFRNWAKKDSATDVYQAGQTITPPQNIELTAQWDVINYTITYDSNGGSAVAPTTYNIEQVVALAAAPTREGWKFTGWKLQKKEGNWTEDDYTAGQVIGTGKYGNITMVAQWKDQYRYVLNFDANTTDTVGNMPANVDTGWIDANKYTAALPTNPTRANYDFLGWATSSNAAAADVLTSFELQGIAHDTAGDTLYAVWQRHTGDLKLTFNGGETSPAIVTVTGQGKTITLVLTKSETVIKNLPTGTYEVTVESGNASYNASVKTNSNPRIEKNQTAEVEIITVSKGLNWFTAFYWVKNQFEKKS